MTNPVKFNAVADKHMEMGYCSLLITPVDLDSVADKHMEMDYCSLGITPLELDFVVGVHMARDLGNFAFIRKDRFCKNIPHCLKRHFGFN